MVIFIKLEMQWLARSTIGRSKGVINYREVQSALFSKGIMVQVRLPNGLHVLLMFGDKKKTEVLLGHYN